CSFQKADAKVRTLKHIFQIFSEVFFHFSFFSLSSSSLLSKGRQKEKGRRTRHRFFKEECQLALLSFSKAGAKVRTLKHNFQMFRKFFSFFFSKAEVPKETYGKEEKNGSLPLRFTVRMSKHRRLRSRKRMQK
ncbi:hypothetical protein POZ09_12185, partial [Bacteroides uniformis]|uniref:hypothetical protein n=1 Tax=Bacteroides uniformis TaxID=820 RepID=UPI002FEE58E2|nr:hypothetical protein [Bacteroides uniformis]